MTFTSFIFATLLFLTYLSGCISTEQSQNLSETNLLAVPKGQTVDISRHLYRLLHSLFPSEDVELSLVGEPWKRCGVLRPNFVTSASLRNNHSTVVFTHFGCRDSMLLLEFHVLSPRAGVRVLNIPLKVTPRRHPLRTVLDGLRIKPLQVTTTFPLRPVSPSLKLYNLEVVFATNVTTDMCSYSIEVVPEVFPVPQFGQLTVAQNVTRIPCGVAPLVPLTYSKHTSFNVSHITDYVLVRLWSKQLTGDSVYTVVEVEFRDSISTATNHRVDEPIAITHSGYSPVPSFIFYPGGHLLSGTVDKRVKIYAPITDCGVFLSQSLPINFNSTNVTVFTLTDLLLESVAFYPTLERCSADLTASASDIAGNILWSTSFAVSVAISHAVSRFDYVLTSFRNVSVTDSVSNVLRSFGSNCSVQLSRPPLNGHLHRTDGSNTRLLPGSVATSIPVTYRSVNGSCDRFSWSVLCGSTNNLVSIFVLPENYPFVSSFYYIKEPMDVYYGFATRVDSHKIRVRIPKTSDSNLTVYLFRESDLRLYLASTNVPPEAYIPLPALVNAYNATLITDNTVTNAQLLNGQVWLVAMSNSSRASKLAVNVESDTEYLGCIKVRIISAPPPSPALLYTPDVVFSTNHVLLLSHSISALQSIIITSPILKSVRPSVLFTILVPPSSGLLCYSADQDCLTPLSNFTYSDLSSQQVIYKQTSNLSSIDGFLLKVKGIPPHWTVVKRSEMAFPTPCNRKPKFVLVERNVSLSLSFFTNFFSLNVVETSSLHFSVAVSPSSGWFSSKVSQTFSLPQLLAGNVTYFFNSSVPQSVPPDECIFAIVQNGIAQFVQLYFVHTRQLISPPSVQTMDIYTAETSTDLADSVILTNLPFSSDAVYLVIERKLRYGRLVHRSREEQRNVPTVLSANCSFSYRSLQQGQIVYEAFSEPGTGLTDEFAFSLSAPSVSPIALLGRQVHTVNIIYKLPYVVAKHLPIVYLSSVGKFGADLKRAIQILPGMAGNVYIYSERSIATIKLNGTNLGSVSLAQLRDNMEASTYVYLPNPENLSPMNTYDTIKLYIISAHRSNLDYEISVAWSVVEFKQPSIVAERSRDGKLVSVPIKYAGTVSERSYIVVNITHISPGVSLDCSSLRGPAPTPSCVCVDRDQTNITLSNTTDVVDLCLFVSSDGSVQSESDGESVRLKLIGYEDAIPLPNKDETVIHLVEFSTVRFAVDHYSGFGDHKQCSQSIPVNETVGVLSIRLERSGNLQERVGIVCSTSDSSSQSYNHRDPLSPRSVVYFEPNSTAAHCNVTINEVYHDNTVRFHVSLSEKAGQHAKPALGKEALCVYVVDHLPENHKVFFKTREQIYQEPTYRNISISTSIFRNLSADVGVQTTMVSYRTVSATALPGRDYMHTATEATFYGSQTELLIKPTLLVNSVDFEEDKYFYIEITEVVVGVAVKGMERLKIIIRDAQVRIGFNSSEITLQEASDYVAYIPVLRSGNLNETITFYCYPSKLDNSLAPYILATSFDHYKTTFQPGQSVANCTIALENDNVYKGVQQFAVDIHILERTHLAWWVRAKPKVLTVSVKDNDEPTIQFSTSSSSNSNVINLVAPPTSCAVDNTVHSIAIVRSGDTGGSFSVRVKSDTQPSAYKNSFRILNPTIQFVPSQVVAHVNVTLGVLSQNVENFAFNLTLLPSSSQVLSMNSFVLGDSIRVGVFVRKVNRKGPLLPGLPLLQRNSTSLACTAPCADSYTTVLNKSCSSLCNWINTFALHYTWEEKGPEAVDFTPLHHKSWLVTTAGSTLDSIFLKYDHQYRCKVRAKTDGDDADEDVDSGDDVSGRVRTSIPFHFKEERNECRTDHPRLNVVISSGKGLADEDSDLLSVSPEDIVKITVTASHVDYFYPSVFLSTLGQNDAALLLNASDLIRNGHKCSNFQPGLNSLLGSGSLVETFPRISAIRTKSLSGCEWKFESWHVVKDLLANCGGASVRKRSESFTLTFRAVYLSLSSSFDHNKGHTDSVVKTLHLSASNCSDTPLAKITSLEQSAILEPLSVTLNLREGTKAALLILRSTLLPSAEQMDVFSFTPHPQIRWDSEHTASIQLVASGNRTQLWTMTVDMSSSATFKPTDMIVTFYCRGTRPCTQKFNLQIFQRIVSDRSSLSLSVPTSLQAVPDTSNRGSMRVNVSVDSLHALKEGVRLCLLSVWACHAPHRDYRVCVPLADAPSQVTMEEGAPITCIGDSQTSNYLSNTSPNNSTEIQFSLSKLYKVHQYREGYWEFVANYTFLEGTCKPVSFHNVSHKQQVTIEVTTTSTPTIDLLAITLPTVLTCILTLVTSAVVISVVLCAFFRWRPKPQHQKPSTDLNAVSCRSIRVIHTRVTPRGSEEFELTQVVTKKENDKNLCVALALEGSKDRKKRTMTNFSSLPLLPTIPEEHFLSESSEMGASYVHRSIRLSTATDNPRTRQSFLGGEGEVDSHDDFHDCVLEYLAVSAPTPSVSRTRLQSDI